MEALELLGSRYIKPQQLAVGPVETLRAQNAATWRVVFIHRVSTTREGNEQADLLKLLTTALVRSSEAKRLVLDFGEEQGFWNVVTESEPQCESLRDWLQAEVDSAQKGEAILSAEQAAAMGEFARLFSRGVKLPPRKAVTAKAPPKATLPPPPEPKAPEQKPPEPPVPVEAATPPVIVAPVAEERGSQAAPGSSEALNAEPPRSALPAFTEERGSQAAPGSSEALNAEPPRSALPAFAEERGSQAAPGSSEALNAEPPRSALPAFTEEPALVPLTPVLAESAPEPEPHPEEPEILPPYEEERPIVFPDPIPVIVIAAPLDPPPGALPVVTEEPPPIPEMEPVLPKAVADAPKVVPIDTWMHEPRADAPKPDAPAPKAVVRGNRPPPDDAPLFANSIPKPSRFSKMTVFFIILGVLAVLLVLAILYLSTNT